MNKLVALDIDGVILKGGVLLSGAKLAVEKLHKFQVPFIFMTNGGGCTENESC